MGVVTTVITAVDMHVAITASAVIKSFHNVVDYENCLKSKG